MTNGGNNRARTYDPLLVRQMLSQLSYASICFTRLDFSRRRLILYHTFPCLSRGFFKKTEFFSKSFRHELDGSGKDDGIEKTASSDTVSSGLRGSNPPPQPWQGCALPNELNPHLGGASGRNRTNDTGIFSPLLYQLSYRGIQQGLYYLATRRGLEPLTSSVTG